LSFWAKDLLLAFYTIGDGTHDRFYDLSLNPRVLAYSFALAILTALLSGLMPALGATRQDLALRLKDDGRVQSSRHHRLRSALVVGQVALSLALLVAAGLLIRSARQVREGANFDPTHVALLRLRPRLVEYSPEKAQTFTREVIRRLEAVPGVQSVSLATGSGGYAWQSRDNVSVKLPEQAGDRPESELQVQFHEIAPRFFESLKMSLLQGRDFNDGDRSGSPRVVVVNETLARQMWPQGSPLGRTLMVNSQPHQVIGLFKDAQPRNALEAPLPFLYLPVWQDAKQIDSRLVVRVASDPQAMLALLRREATAVDPKVPISEVMPMMQQMEAEYVPVLLTSSVAACAGVIALLLSMIGLYGVLSFMVSQRTREIGIRMALGAQRHDVLKLVVGQGMSLALFGVALGSVAAVGLSRVLASLLFGVSATDPTTFALSALLLLALALFACYLPARRATKVDPQLALRYE
jgi:predicted permease